LLAKSLVVQDGVAVIGAEKTISARTPRVFCIDSSVGDELVDLHVDVWVVELS
jgi:hypothetical protein